MSIKGLTKGFQRLPQQLKQRINHGDITKDAQFDDAELRFSGLEKETKKLKEETTKYFQSINGMLDHQIGFSKACAEVYNPISGRASDLSSYVIDSNPEGIRASEEYIAIVEELKMHLAPELEMIKTRVVAPAQELTEIVHDIRKRCTKRSHKQLDYDAAKNRLKKLQDKPDKSAKDEKELWNAENSYEEVSQVYMAINEELKEQLGELFVLEREFIVPLFQSFYYMQLNVFYTLHERMQNIDIGYFDLTKGIEEAFEEKRGDVQEQAEQLSICRFKTTGRPRPPRAAAGRLAIEGRNSTSSGKLALENGTDSPSSPIGRSSYDAYDNPPPYDNGGLGRSASAGRNWGATAKGKPAPPPPKPKPGRLGGHAETVTALYDYEAQAQGDLSFGAGDVIDVISRTDNENEWWVGKIGIRQGQFPGNYVQLNP